jgi:hypothetical protein
LDSYEIIVKRYSPADHEIKIVKKLCFAEAVAEAYNLRNKRGFEWKIESVRKMRIRDV